MAIPIVVGGIAAAAKTDAGKAVIKKVGQVVGGLISGNQDQKENLFLRHRDAVYTTLRGNSWTPESEWSPIAAKYKMSIADIKDSTSVEFSRLHQFVQQYLNQKQPGLGDAFIAKQWLIADELRAQYNDPSRSYKGAANEGLQWALSNRNNLPVTEILNNSDGLGISQAYVNELGQVVVPSTQQGEGIFSQLNNYASAQLNKIGSQLLSGPAASVSGQQQLTSGGGVTLTGGVNVGGSVTKNTTSTDTTKGDSSIVWLLGAVVVLFLVFTGGLKKLFG